MDSVVADDNVTPVGWSGVPAGPANRRSRHSSRTATPAELAGMLSKVIGGSSLLLALWVGAEEVAMTSDEADAVAAPTARMLARSKLAKRMTKQLAGASDGIDLAFALALYGLRISPYIQQKVNNRARPTDPSSLRQEPAANGAAAQPSAAGNGLNGLNGHIPGGYGAYSEPSEAGAGLDFGGGIRPIW